jgi:hypothetical protein
MRNYSVQGFDIHGENEFVSAMKLNVLKDLESMFGILDVVWYVLNKGCLPPPQALFRARLRAVQICGPLLET